MFKISKKGDKGFRIESVPIRKLRLLAADNHRFWRLDGYFLVLESYCFLFFLFFCMIFFSVIVFYFVFSCCFLFLVLVM